MNMPIIELTVRDMKHSILMALSDFQAERDEYIREAVEKWCDPENVKAVVAQHVTQVLNAAVRDEVERFYRVGRGREVIREIVEKHLGG